MGQIFETQGRRHRAGKAFVGSGGGSRNAAPLGLTVPERDGPHKGSEIEKYALWA
jgi:hypothetical protein